MVPRIHAGGKSFSGVVAYLTHDAGTLDERRPKTAERVGMVELENLPECRPATAARIMAGTAREADTLKRLADVSTRGRKLDKPVYHFSLSWSPEERPERAEMLTAARGSLEALGMGNRQALVVEHTDRAHRHVHVVVNRVSPEDGRAASCSNDARTLSRWAQTWEREQGRVRCPGRRPADLERSADKQQLAQSERPAAQQRSPGRRSSTSERKERAELHTRHRTERDGVRDRHRAERRDLSRSHQQSARAVEPAPVQQPSASRRRRGPGRRGRSAAEREEWAAQYARHRAEQTDVRDRHRREREQLDLRHQAETQPAPVQKPPETREDALRAPSGSQRDLPLPDVPTAPTGRERGEQRPVTAEAPPPARSSSVSYEHQVNLAADKAEAHLPKIQHSRSGLSLVAISDDTFRRLTAGTDDQFVKDTISAVSGRQPLQHSPPEYEQFEEAYHRSAIDREHDRRLAAHQAEHGRRWWQLRRTSMAPEPERRASAVEVIQRHLPQLRRIFEESCAWVRQQFQGRLAERRKDFDALSVTSPPPMRPTAHPRIAVARPPDRNHAQPDPSPRVEQLLQERERIEQLRRDARRAWSEGRYGDQTDLERTSQVAENELEQKVRELPSSELREYQQREQARDPDRGGPSR